MFNRNSIFYSFALALAFAHPLRVASSQVTYRRIALTGDAPPGIVDGSTYNTFNSAVLNNSGDVAMEASLLAPDGVFDHTINNAYFGPSSGRDSPLSLLAREGQPAIGFHDGSVFNNPGFTLPVLNDNGDVAFSMRVKQLNEPNHFVDDYALFGPTAGTGTELGVLALAGTPVLGDPEGAVIRSPSRILLNNAGDIALTAQMRYADDPPNIGHLGALLARQAQSDDFHLLVREGLDVTGSPNANFFGAFYTPHLLETGNMLIPFLPKEALALEPDTINFGVLQTAVDRDATHDEVVVNVDLSTILSLPNDALFDPPERVRLDASGGWIAKVSYSYTEIIGPGQVVIHAESALIGSSIDGNPIPHVLIDSREAAPGSVDGTRVRHWTDLKTNDNNDLALLAYLEDAEGNIDYDREVGLFGPLAGTGSLLGPIWQENDPAPGVIDGAVCDSPRLTDTGRGIFHAATTGACLASNWSGVM